MSFDVRTRGFACGCGRARRLMRRRGITVIYPKSRTFIDAPENKVDPYLLRSLDLCRPNQVWCLDIT